MSLITFLSDFGEDDWFVGAVKGEILKLNRDARIIDITHRTPPHDIRAAAFILRSYYNTFPPGTIHLAVVDPGVGGTRKPIIVRTDTYRFVGPDNGLFSYIYTDRSEVYQITQHMPASSTFHARDIFGPCAALLARGQAARTFGPRLYEYERFAFPGITEKGGTIQGQVAYIDHFGNCITTIPSTMDINGLQVHDHTATVKQCYADGQQGELIAVKGSCGLYEIVINGASAAAYLDARIGMIVTVSG